MLSIRFYKLFFSIIIIVPLFLYNVFLSADSLPDEVSGFKSTQKKPLTYSYRIKNSFPHDKKAFTQGLIYIDSVLYESTGLNGQSSLRKVKLETGEVLKKYTLADKFFGEGLTVIANKLIQLTWRSRQGFVYDRNTFELLEKFSYPTEGWGLTYDGRHLIMSDGSSILYFLNPKNYKVVKQINVTDRAKKIVRLNELEYIEGEIYANIWQTNWIARIDPQSGQVLAWIDLTGLLTVNQYHNSADVLNGIAFDKKSNRLFVTGKLWPKLFEIELFIPDDTTEQSKETVLH